MKPVALLAGAIAFLIVLVAETSLAPGGSLPALFMLPMGAGLVVIYVGLALAVAVSALTALIVQGVSKLFTSDGSLEKVAGQHALVTPQQRQACSEAADLAMAEYCDRRTLSANCPVCRNTIKVAYAARPEVFVVACACGACRREYPAHR